MSFLSEINKHLFLASEDALTRKEFKRKGITHVVSVIQSKVVVADSIKHLHIPLADSPQENIRCHFEKVLAFIDEAIAQDGKVLVHCEKGMSRSASFVIAWLMHDQHRQGLKVDYARILQDLIQIRSAVSPNKGFALQLMNYAEELNINLTSLDKDSLLNVMSYLSPKEWSALSCTSRFFKHFMAKDDMDKLWIAQLKQQFKLSEMEITFWREKKLSFPALFKLYTRLKTIIPLPVNLAFAVGFFGCESLCKLFINTQGKSELEQILAGAIVGFKSDLVQQHLGSLSPEVCQKLVNYAVMVDNVAVLGYFDGYPINWHIRNPQGNNLLFMAAFHGSYNAFVYLHLTKGVDPTQHNNTGATLLQTLCYSSNGQLIDYIKGLNCLDPDEPNYSGLTPRTIATKRKNTLLLSAFEQWPDPSDQQSLGVTKS
ncbi:dual specificity protein phosphatase family protein [Legionella taurinensis]|uniref:dual specificity protein phosphatase family protein n=1 Tax=Legionella taurinensis TaxID=70611 RepID=UPI001C7D4584|nr:dual specificity protein phosphatase family protein [Legionella taurinensis]